MQIPAMSSLNSAAGTLQAIATSKPEGSSSHGTSPVSMSIANVEGATKPGDRDANEFYSQQESSRASASVRQDASPASDDPPLSMTDLPADDGESHALDCWG